MTKKQQTLLERLAALKDEQKEIGAKVLAAEADLIAELESLGQKTVTSGGSLTGTLVKGSTITIDEEALKKALGAALWKKVTKQVLDKERLEAHIVTGDVDPNIVASVSTEKDRKPFIKVSGALPKSAPAAAPSGSVSTTNSAGQKKPAARRVRKPKP